MFNKIPYSSSDESAPHGFGTPVATAINKFNCFKLMFFFAAIIHYENNWKIN